ncbi:MAG: hypothetical protein LUO80_10955 [Methylococcaceae bacterium]|jgi:hypothetical protein|nr:hypothetical protein [Methylococcaceae bacterium]
MKEPAVDLNEVISKHRWDLKANYESEADAVARRTQEAENAALEREKARWLFRFSLTLTLLVFCGSLYLFVSGTTDDKKWAAALISGITSGLSGFLVGQSKK